MGWDSLNNTVRLVSAPSELFVLFRSPIDDYFTYISVGCSSIVACAVVGKTEQIISCRDKEAHFPCR